MSTQSHSRFRVTLRTPELRAKLGRMTQAELARRAGLSKATVSNLESGNLKRIELETLAKLSAALQCRIDELFEVATEPQGTLLSRQKTVLHSLIGSMQYDKPVESDAIDAELARLTDDQYKKPREKLQRRKAR